MNNLDNENSNQQHQVNNEQIVDAVKHNAMEWGNKAFNFGLAAHKSTNEKDEEMWALIRDVPTLTGIYPYVCLALNFFIPGSGTITSGFLVKDGVWSKTQLSIGVV